MATLHWSIHTWSPHSSIKPLFFSGFLFFFFFLILFLSLTSAFLLLITEVRGEGGGNETPAHPGCSGACVREANTPPSPHPPPPTLTLSQSLLSHLNGQISNFSFFFLSFYYDGSLVQSSSFGAEVSILGAPRGLVPTLAVGFRWRWRCHRPLRVHELPLGGAWDRNWNGNFFFLVGFFL